MAEKPWELPPNGKFLKANHNCKQSGSAYNDTIMVEMIANLRDHLSGYLSKYYTKYTRQEGELKSASKQHG
jgi:hypothetical protein